MIRKLIMVLVAVGIVLGGFGPLSGVMISPAEASDNPAAMSDCASMMEMKGSQADADCPSNDRDSQNTPMKCPADNCTLRCGTISAQTAVSFVHYLIPSGLPDLLPELMVHASAAGKPPLRPPCSSIPA